MVTTQTEAIDLAQTMFIDIFRKNARVAKMPDGYARSLKVTKDGTGITVKVDYKTRDGKPLDIFLDEGTQGHFVEPRDEDGVLKFGDFFSKGHYVSGIKGKMILARSQREFFPAYERRLRELNN